MAKAKFFIGWCLLMELLTLEQIEGGYIMLTLEILYYPETSQKGKPFRVARLSDGLLLERAAETVIEDAESIATKLSAVDGGLASMQRAEIDRLRRVLSRFVPHLRSQESRALAS